MDKSQDCTAPRAYPQIDRETIQVFENAKKVANSFVEQYQPCIQGMIAFSAIRGATYAASISHSFDEIGINHELSKTAKDVEYFTEPMARLAANAHGLETQARLIQKELTPQLQAWKSSKEHFLEMFQMIKWETKQFQEIHQQAQLFNDRTTSCNLAQIQDISEKMRHASQLAKTYAEIKDPTFRREPFNPHHLCLPNLAGGDELSGPNFLSGRFVMPSLQNSESCDLIPSENIIAKEGRTWTLTFASKTIHCPHRVGFIYIRFLLCNPEKPFKAIDLRNAFAGLSPKSSIEAMRAKDLHYGGSLANSDQARCPTRFQTKGDPELVIDDIAMQEYKKRLLELQDRRLEAQDLSDQAELEAIDFETSQIEDYLNKNTNKRNRSRRFSGEDEKARQSVNRAIRRALAEVEGSHQALHVHLTKYLSFGYTLCYDPGSRIPWDI